MTDLGRHLTSDPDGVRHVVLGREDDGPREWRTLVWSRDDDVATAPPRREAAFQRRTVWGEPGNLLGFGERRKAWTVVVDRGEVAEVEIGGSRHRLVDDEDGTA